ncbi:MAG: hypothetical protein LUG52_08850 [Clostridia bacterium]|nr:hypothetical protein [Clostridia bacterium]
MDDKMVFEIPEMEIVRFSQDDVTVTASLTVTNDNTTGNWSGYFGETDA